MTSEELLWSPEEKRKAGTQVELFRQRINKKHALTLTDYEQLPELLS